jgi:hypothetical protein
MKPGAGSGAGRPRFEAQARQRPAGGAVLLQSAEPVLPDSAKLPAAQKDFSTEMPASAKARAFFESAQLPAAWRKILSKVRPAPIAWTYPELGHDLLLSGNAARSRALKELIQALNLAKGSSTFWPASLPDVPEGRKSDQPVSADIFRSGLDYLGVKYLIVFGEETLRGTSYEKLTLKPFAEQILNGRLLLPLPPFELLLKDNSWMEMVTRFLRSVLSTFYGS